MLLIAALAVTQGCRHHTNDDRAISPKAGLPVEVLVTNHYSTDMQVVAVGSGINYPLGTVAPEMSGHFILPQALVIGTGRIEFVAQPAGVGPLAHSGYVMVTPGNVVEFVIGAQLFNSSATVHTSH